MSYRSTHRKFSYHSSMPTSLSLRQLLHLEMRLENSHRLEATRRQPRRFMFYVSECFGSDRKHLPGFSFPSRLFHHPQVPVRSSTNQSPIGSDSTAACFQVAPLCLDVFRKWLVYIPGFSLPPPPPVHQPQVPATSPAKQGTTSGRTTPGSSQVFVFSLNLHCGSIWHFAWRMCYRSWFACATWHGLSRDRIQK